MFNMIEGSLLDALMAIYPQYSWRNSKRKVLQDLGVAMGVHHWEDWYQVSLKYLSLNKDCLLL